MTDISLLLPKPGFVPLQFLLGPKRLKTCNDQLKMNFTRLKILRTPSISPPGWTLAVRFLRGQSLLVNLIYTLYIYIYVVFCSEQNLLTMHDGLLLSNGGRIADQQSIYVRYFPQSLRLLISNSQVQWTWLVSGNHDTIADQQFSEVRSAKNIAAICMGNDEEFLGWGSEVRQLWCRMDCCSAINGGQTTDQQSMQCTERTHLYFSVVARRFRILAYHPGSLPIIQDPRHPGSSPSRLFLSPLVFLVLAILLAGSFRFLTHLFMRQYQLKTSK